MKKYYIEKKSNKDYRIVEKKTNFVLRQQNNFKDALNCLRKLEGGCAFAGDTPSFFVNKKEQL